MQNQNFWETDFTSLESLGWDFSQLWADGASDEKTPEIVEAEMKERFHVRITKNETGNFFWQLADNKGRTYGDKQSTGDDSKTEKDIAYDKLLKALCNGTKSTDPHFCAYLRNQQDELIAFCERTDQDYQDEQVTERYFRFEVLDKYDQESIDFWAAFA